MEEIDTATALRLLKARLNRLPDDTTLDETLMARIEAEIGSLERIGITLTGSMDDMMLVVDGAAWDYSNRDKPGSMPEWLRLRRRERWLKG